MKKVTGTMKLAIQNVLRLQSQLTDQREMHRVQPKANRKIINDLGAV